MSNQPLPAYHSWRKALGKSPWAHHEAAPDAVYYDDGTFLETWTAKRRSRSERGKGQTATGPAAIVRLTDWLRRPEIEATAALGFTVQTKEK